MADGILSLLGRSLARRRILLAVLAPVVVLVAFSTYVVQEKLQDFRESHDLLLTAQVARATHALARELEDERDLSLENVDHHTLEEQRKVTDRQTVALNNLLAQPQMAHLFPPHEHERLDLGRIDSLRVEIDRDRRRAAALGPVIDDVLALPSRLGEISAGRMISAYMDLGNAKERLARERSLSMALLRKGRPDPNLQTQFIQAHAERHAFLESLRSHASAEQWRMLEESLRGPAMEEVERLHHLAVSGVLRAGDSGDLLAAHAAVDDGFARAEEALAHDMENRMSDELRNAQATFYGVLLVVLVLVAFSLETMRRSESRAIRAEDEARKLFRAVEQSPVSVMITDPLGAVEYVNPAFTRMTQYGRAEILGKNPRILQSTRTPRDAYTQLWRTISAGQEWRGEIQNRRKDGSVYWEQMIIAPVRGSDGGVDNYIALKEDVTLRKQAEEALHGAREAAELASRAKSEFLATMSHELRTPLNAIIGFSEIIEGELLGPVGQPQYLDYARDILLSGRHLLQLINDILDVARLEMGRVDLREEDLDVAQLIQAGLALVRERAEFGHITLESHLPDAPLRLKADERRVKQVLANILGNAVKFTPAGGTVTVSAHTLSAGPNPPGLVIVISDTGIGISPDDLAKVMAPFGQVDSGLARRYEGSGLGLPLSRQLMDLHGGTLELESGLGQGTVVRLVFPPHRVKAAQPA